MVALRQKPKKNILHGRKNKMPYKADCKFKRLLNLCTFKEIDCNSEKCDMYNVKFDTKSLKHEIKKIEKEIKFLTKENISLKKIKAMVSLEKKDKNSLQVKKYKMNLVKINDLGHGLEYMKTAYRYCKRTKSFGRF